MFGMCNKQLRCLFYNLLITVTCCLIFWQALREELHYVNSLLKGHRELGLMVQKQLDEVLARQKSAK
jgi:type II secretory pathway component PulM